MFREAKDASCIDKAMGFVGRKDRNAKILLDELRPCV